MHKAFLFQDPRLRRGKHAGIAPTLIEMQASGLGCTNFISLGSEQELAGDGAAGAPAVVPGANPILGAELVLYAAPPEAWV